MTDTTPAQRPSSSEPRVTTRSDARELPIGELVSRLSDQLSTLVRDEMQLAKVELSGKAKRAGAGAGMFGVAGVSALIGAMALAATAILALALVLPGWASALIVGVLLFAFAGLAALAGLKQTKRAAPPVPEQAVAGVRRDVDVVKEHARP